MQANIPKSTIKNMSNDQVLFLWSISKPENIFSRLPRDLVKCIYDLLPHDYFFLAHQFKFPIEEPLRFRSKAGDIVSWDGAFLCENNQSSQYCYSSGAYSACFKIVDRGHSMAVCAIEFDGDKVTTNPLSSGELSTFNSCWNIHSRHAMYLWGGSLVTDFSVKIGKEVSSSHLREYENGDTIAIKIDISNDLITYTRRKSTENSQPVEIFRMHIGKSPYKNPRYAIGINNCGAVDVIVEKIGYKR